MSGPSVSSALKPRPSVRTQRIISKTAVISPATIRAIRTTAMTPMAIPKNEAGNAIRNQKGSEQSQQVTGNLVYGTILILAHKR
jgi:hypothetical protein